MYKKIFFITGVLLYFSAMVAGDRKELKKGLTVLTSRDEMGREKMVKDCLKQLLKRSRKNSPREARDSKLLNYFTEDEPVDYKPGPSAP